MRCHKLLVILLVLSILVAVFAGCQGTPKETLPPDNEKETTISTDESDTDTDDESETETEPPLPDSAEKVEFSDDTDTTPDETDPPSEDTETESEPETEPEEPARIYHYLNGTTVTAEEQKRRPVAIMINNIEKCLPQEGISYGDMFYECAAEGGITRLMMVTCDYDKIPVIGSVRSSRDYFVDFLANHEAIYVHAGGSPLAYEKISWRGINNLDGVNMYLPDAFYRDSWRLNNMGYEHSLMITGEKLAGAIQYKGYSTTLPDNYVCPFVFYDEETDNHLIGSPATHIHMKSTAVQTVDFVYNQETGEYLRYQYNGKPHVDATNNWQISVKNILILFTDMQVVDEYGRLGVETVGSGQGYYITNGKRKVVNWSRDGKTTPIHIEYRNGDELILNCGKTFICVVEKSVASKIDFEYSW